MSPESHADPTVGATEPPSRRSVLRGAAGVGAVGLAAAVGVGAAAAPALAAAKPGTARPADTAGPLVVYLRDAASGELDVFAGTSHAVIRDSALVARLTSAVRPSSKH